MKSSVLLSYDQHQQQQQQQAQPSQPSSQQMQPQQSNYQDIQPVVHIPLTLMRISAWDSPRNAELSLRIHPVSRRLMLFIVMCCGCSIINNRLMFSMNHLCLLGFFLCLIMFLLLSSFLLFWLFFVQYFFSCFHFSLLMVLSLFFLS
jgi:hypothetical protein